MALPATWQRTVVTRALVVSQTAAGSVHATSTSSREAGQGGSQAPRRPGGSHSPKPGGMAGGAGPAPPRAGLWRRIGRRPGRALLASVLVAVAVLAGMIVGEFEICNDNSG